MECPQCHYVLHVKDKQVYHNAVVRNYECLICKGNYKTKESFGDSGILVNPVFVYPDVYKFRSLCKRFGFTRKLIHERFNFDLGLISKMNQGKKVNIKSVERFAKLLSVKSFELIDQEKTTKLVLTRPSTRRCFK